MARKKTTAKKTTRKKATRKTAKKPVARKKAVKKVAKKTTGKKTPIRSAYNKSAVLNEIAEQTDLKRKDVAAVFESLEGIIHRHLRKGGAGEFTVPGLMKCVVKHKPATKARKGINPFTGEPTTFKAKPARKIVKVRPLKKLKEMAS